jgi:2-polyprenyl-6-hydroxyphenyl methylase/3-demethylubiquinone-9 3-methyltransferase
MSATHSNSNVDPEELGKFEALAHRWWDPEGDFKPLHDINPVRLQYVQEHAKLLAAPVLDVGCGGGILAEGMAELGARVTGIDMAEKPLNVARLHALESGAEVEYLTSTAEAMAEQRRESFGTVTCMEMLEHVPDFASTVQACADLTTPGGDVFFSTINRNPKSYALAVVGAEYILGLLPKGTHDYAKFIRPSELSAAVRQAGLELKEIIGMRYNPLTRSCRLSSDVDVNYLLYARKP